MPSSLEITPSGEACGAAVRGIDLRDDLSREQVAELRALWLQYHVLSFPEQDLSDDDLERIATCFGVLGEDPFFGAIPGREHIAAIRREADDTSPIFAEAFHSDWSFMVKPPIATLLYSLDIPPAGGDTFFVNQHRALESMPSELRSRLEGKYAQHCAKYVYAPDGIYGDDADTGSMDIRPSERAFESNPHLLVRPHPETGELGLFGAPFGYIVSIDGMPDEQAHTLIGEMHLWQTQEQFQYCHKWQEGMLLMWDNRSVLHRASGGFEGYRRELHRVTIYGTDEFDRY